MSGGHTLAGVAVHGLDQIFLLLQLLKLIQLAEIIQVRDVHLNQKAQV